MNKNASRIDALGIAEFIAEFFYDQDVEKVWKIWGTKAYKALQILEDMGLIKVENERIILTSNGKEFVDLPID